MMKKLSGILSCLIVVALVFIMLKGLTDLTERKTADIKYADFWKQDADFDVLFLGSSHVINGIYPMELWDKYGIVSYNFGGHSALLPTSYWVMENALKYTNPKVVVIDGYMMESMWKGSNNFTYLHQSFDAFPLSLKKIAAVNDLLNDEYLETALETGNVQNEGEERTKLGLLWNFSTYHSRWNEITQGDFVTAPGCEKGAEYRDSLFPMNKENHSPEGNISSCSTGEIYLRRMIEECQERDIDVVLTLLPFDAMGTDLVTAEKLYNIASEYDIRYVNYVDMDVINFQTDFCDNGLHLNPSGAKKVTSHLGKILSEDYSVPNHHYDSRYDFWNDDYKAYLEYKDNKLKHTDRLLTYLMLLYGEDVRIVIDFRSMNVIENQTFISLLVGLGIDVGQLIRETDFAILDCKTKRFEIVNAFRNSGMRQNTSMGEINYYVDDVGGNYFLSLDNNVLVSGNDQDDFDINIAVFRGSDLIDEVYFSLDVNENTCELTEYSVIRK